MANETFRDRCFVCCIGTIVYDVQSKTMSPSRFNTFSRQKLLYLLDASYDFRKTFLQYLPVTDLSNAVRALDIKLSQRETGHYLHPLRAFSDCFERLEEFIGRGWGITLFGPKIDDILVDILAPGSIRVPLAQKILQKVVTFLRHMHLRNYSATTKAVPLPFMTRKSECWMLFSQPSGWDDPNVDSLAEFNEVHDFVKNMPMSVFRGSQTEVKTYLGLGGTNLDGPVVTKLPRHHWGPEDQSPLRSRLPRLQYLNLHIRPWDLEPKFARAGYVPSNKPYPYNSHGLLVEYHPDTAFLLNGYSSPITDVILDGTVVARIPVFPCCDYVEGDWLAGRWLYGMQWKALRWIPKDDECKCECHNEPPGARVREAWMEW